MSVITIAKPQVEIDEEVRHLVQTQEERVTIVHCYYLSAFPTYARIWPTTYLIEEDGTKRQLLHAFNISFAPNWTKYRVANDYVRFTLLFEALGRTCNLFHLKEEISESQAFYTHNIQRNRSDVYEAELSFTTK